LRTILSFFIAAIFAINAASASEPPSLNGGVFTKLQAKSGKRLYKKFCSSCHEGNYFNSVLLAWKGETLSDLYGIIKSEMPENDPGSLAQDQYSEILAYILNSSHYPAGEHELDPDAIKFSEIMID
jgi:mono/diheme cytochrome c family protein